MVMVLLSFCVLFSSRVVLFAAYFKMNCCIFFSINVKRFLIILLAYVSEQIFFC